MRRQRPSELFFTTILFIILILIQLLAPPVNGYDSSGEKNVYLEYGLYYLGSGGTLVKCGDYLVYLRMDSDGHVRNFSVTPSTYPSLIYTNCPYLSQARQALDTLRQIVENRTAQKELSSIKLSPTALYLLQPSIGDENTGAFYTCKGYNVLSYSFTGKRGGSIEGSVVVMLSEKGVPVSALLEVKKSGFESPTGGPYTSASVLYLFKAVSLKEGTAKDIGCSDRLGSPLVIYLLLAFMIIVIIFAIRSFISFKPANFLERREFTYQYEDYQDENYY